MNCSYEYGNVCGASGKETMRKQSKHGMCCVICLVASCAVFKAQRLMPKLWLPLGPKLFCVTFFLFFMLCTQHNDITFIIVCQHIWKYNFACCFVWV